MITGKTGRQKGKNTLENRQTGRCRVIRIQVDTERYRGSETGGEISRQRACRKKRGEGQKVCCWAGGRR